MAKFGSKKQQPKSKLSYRTNTFIKNKRQADSKHILVNGGYAPQQDTIQQVSRHEQTIILFWLRTDHCRL